MRYPHTSYFILESMWVFLIYILILSVLLLTVEAVRSSPYTMTYTINYNVCLDWYGNLIAPGIIFLCPEGADMAMAGV